MYNFFCGIGVWPRHSISMKYIFFLNWPFPILWHGIKALSRSLFCIKIIWCIDKPAKFKFWSNCFSFKSWNDVHFFRWHVLYVCSFSIRSTVRKIHEFLHWKLIHITLVAFNPCIICTEGTYPFFLNKTNGSLLKQIPSFLSLCSD